ncbi:hypothetical protein PG997_005297 [Apiospora hydei]|uniref:Peptidoglycan binding-like domain-containing protein n=1 Tax=Apiospora hydei TaxID=1337664 RepID=A0ABR1X4J1_9PEZI
MVFRILVAQSSLPMLWTLKTNITPTSGGRAINRNTLAAYQTARGVTPTGTNNQQVITAVLWEFTLRADDPLVPRLQDLAESPRPQIVKTCDREAYEMMATVSYDVPAQYHRTGIGDVGAEDWCCFKTLQIPSIAGIADRPLNDEKPTLPDPAIA